MSADASFAEWAIVELMGHRRLAGYVSEQQIAGAAFLRIDLLDDGTGQAFTQFYGAGSVYCLTPTSEAVVRKLAERGSAPPVARWELERAAQSDKPSTNDDDSDWYDSGDESDVHPF